MRKFYPLHLVSCPYQRVSYSGLLASQSEPILLWGLGQFILRHPLESGCGIWGLHLWPFVYRTMLVVRVCVSVLALAVWDISGLWALKTTWYSLLHWLWPQQNISWDFSLYEERDLWPWEIIFHYIVCSLDICVWVIWSIFHHVGEGNGTPLQYSCLENCMDGGAW